MAQISTNLEGIFEVRKKAPDKTSGRAPEKKMMMGPDGRAVISLIGSCRWIVGMARRGAKSGASCGWNLTEAEGEGERDGRNIFTMVVQKCEKVQKPPKPGG